MHPEQRQETHGLDYPPLFLDSLPILSRNEPQPNRNPIRLLSSKTFADLHLKHILSHPQDHILFPFLHGLEGNNHAQNAFFHSSAIGAPTKSYGSPASVSANYAAKVPRYRGLVWVVCEDDLQLDGNETALSVLRRRPASESDSDGESEESSESSSSSFGDDEESEEEPSEIHHNKDVNESFTPLVASASGMDLDHDVREVTATPLVPLHQDLSDGKHMHPVQHRPTIQTTNLMVSQPIPIASPQNPSTNTTTGSAGSSSATSSADSSVSGSSYFAAASPVSTATSVDSVACSPTGDGSPSCCVSQGTTPGPPTPPGEDTDAPQSVPQSPPLDTSDSSTHTHTDTAPKAKTACFSPPLLTSTFRPKELLRRVAMESKQQGFNNEWKLDTKTPIKSDSDSDSIEIGNEWEFVPACVPDGISLRNFGIQVPIYATLSDIVVYSPKGPTKRASALAERFRVAIERKRKERIEKRRAARLANQNSQKTGNGTGKAGRPGMRSLPSFYGESAMENGVAGPRSDNAPTVPDTTQSVNSMNGVIPPVSANREADDDDDDDDVFLRYNVFVLSSNEDEMRKELPHLVMRYAVGPESSASAGWDVGDCPGKSIAVSGGAILTKVRVEQGNGIGMDVDAPVLNDMGMELDMDLDLDLQASTARLRGGNGRIQRQMHNLEDDEAPNAVDFAQREKEEMRDLTRASEIISVIPPSLDSDELSDEPLRDLSGTRTTTHWEPMVGQVFLGNANDVPLVCEAPVRLAQVPQANTHHMAVAVEQNTSQHGVLEQVVVEKDPEEVKEEDPLYYRSTNNPESGMGYDICVECHDLAPFPSTAHLRAAEEHLATLEKMWVDRCREKMLEKRLTQGTRGGGEGQHQQEMVVPPRPPPNANAVIHLPFPSSPSNSQATMASLIPVIRFLEKCIKPVTVPPTISLPDESSSSASSKQEQGFGSSTARRWSSVGAHTSLFTGVMSSAANAVRTRSHTTPHLPSPYSITQPQDTRSRPLKILIYSADGYTESSVPALCLLMANRGLSLPEVYLELQVVKRRSFFVYQGDLGILKRVEGRLREERERERIQRQARERQRRIQEDGELEKMAYSGSSHAWGGVSWYMSEMASMHTSSASSPAHQQQHHSHHHHHGRPAAKSVSFAQSPVTFQSTPSIESFPQMGEPGRAGFPPMTVDSPSSMINGIGNPISGSVPNEGRRAVVKGRPRANTSPWLPSFIRDHQSWFNDPRFDGSFPSRVLPFLYLGNLNHALNAYMLHALGITHVVSVGECALVPPPQHTSYGGQGGYISGPCQRSGPAVQYVAGKGPGGQGSLWIEEMEGRIKVLDIKGVCDDGIDTLEPQLEPICDWIDKGRQEGGKVLVHCRVGVSRSATVMIAYVMKHLGISLVDAYLVVRSRRLSVLIQPNMRLLYNLCGWEIQLAKERAGGDEKKLKTALARTLSWPYLAKEVHALNEKYLH
ncbi:hypothetical protein AX17_006437 [Amanita inopinata Kibby_2008]|nr:hypothetical protein AX17_006437 [Amanita inopinata Kibby_2008]